MKIVENTDILIIGAGPSGSVAAAYLQKMGSTAIVVEKTKFPRIVVGESLLPRSMDHFEEAGLLDNLMQKGFEKKLGARFIRGNEICIFDFSKKFGKGWDWTWQVPRADFDLALTEDLQAKGVDLRFETEVIDVVFTNGKSVTTIQDKNGNQSQIQAKFIIDCSGYGRVLPRLLALDTPSQLSPHSAIFTHIHDVNRPAGQEGIQISFDIIEREVWLWVIPFSNGNTSVGIVAPTTYIEQLSTNDSLQEKLTNAINASDFYKKRFGGLPFIFEPKHLKNYSKAVHKMYGDGFVLTGNSAEFLDPVFSSGVCFATESGLLAAKLAYKQLQGENVNWEQDYAAHMEKGIKVFTTYVKEWYTGNLQTLFFHQPEDPDVKAKICAVLAGYVWNDDNPFVKKHDNLIKNMAHFINMSKE
ncbi:tryptophan 7-halogenase [Flavobacterium agricola]|uniref:Tryptophan 7-halogenase n=1 Tax=Flavobacterium agricola TaxID=2870839 RepID=A0ABY6M020_9FLAO|nr:NAD(P)/FAD-dependent oxidoreductase [Flavobacterium agricola]UYW01014.1 tryptophan 7-halogenase [Flavobacterium agricola]